MFSGGSFSVTMTTMINSLFSWMDFIRLICCCIYLISCSIVVLWARFSTLWKASWVNCPTVVLFPIHICKEFRDLTIYNPWYHDTIYRIWRNLCKGQGQNPTFNACDLLSFRRHCVKNRWLYKGYYYIGSGTQFIVASINTS